MDHLLEEAFLEAIYIEKCSFSFYMKMAGAIKDLKTRKLFNLLASEEAGHLERLVSCFPGNSSNLLTVLEKPGNLHEELFNDSINRPDEDISEKEALEISLREENACIDRYATFVATIRIPQIREVFEYNLNETRGHYDVIANEYMRVMGMVNDADQNVLVRE